MSCNDCNDCENFCTSEITCVDANFTNILVSADATLNDVLEAIDEGMVSLTGPQGAQGAQGPQGIQGTAGTAGTAGDRGNAGSNSLIWDSSNGPLTAGGFDSESPNTSFQSVTAWNFNKTSKTGYAGVNGATGNASAWLGAITIGDIIQVHQVDDNTKFGIYTVNQFNYSDPMYSFAVTLLAANSTFDTNKQYTVSFVKKGLDAPFDVIPVGSIQMYASTEAPLGGWLPCNGDVLPIANYPDLYAVIGSTFNYGSVGVGDFQLPNFNGRVPIGTGSVPGSSTYINLADAAGDSLKTIQEQELPQHMHPITDNGHEHNIAVSNTGISTLGALVVSSSSFPVSSLSPLLPATTEPHTTAILNATTGITVDNNNSANTAISLMQPYLGINFIIKY